MNTAALITLPLPNLQTKTAADGLQLAAKLACLASNKECRSMADCLSTSAPKDIPLLTAVYFGTVSAANNHWH